MAVLRERTDSVAKPPSPSSRRLQAVLVALRPVLLACGFFVTGLSVAVQLDYDPRSRLVPVAIQVALAAAVVIVALLWNYRGARGWASDLAAAAASAFPAVLLAVALHGSLYPVGGVGVSQANRMPAVARYAETWKLVDYSYEGLPAFYPPLMPWVLGRVTALFDLAPYGALKIGEIFLVFLGPLLAYVLWRRLLPTPIAAFVPVVIVGLISVTPLMLQQPDSLVALCVIIPWWLDAVYGLRRDTVRPWPLWVHGVIGALLFCLYYYYFFPLAVSLVLLPLLRRWHVHGDGRPFTTPVRVLSLAALLSSLYWAPFAWSWLTAEEPISLQNRWFVAKNSTLPVDVFEPTPLGMLMLFGLLHVAVTARRHRISAGLLLLLIAGYAWYVLGFALTAVGKPVLVFRTEAFVELVLLIAGMRAVAALIGWLLQRVRSDAAIHVRDASRAVTVTVVALVFVIGQSTVQDTLTDRYVRQSHDTPRPDGQRQPYAGRDAHRPVVSDRRLEAAVREITDSAGQPVVLATSVQMLKFSGVYVFNQWHAIYAHPAGEFRARVEFIKQLADERDPHRLANLARNNRFDSIDVILLEGEGEELNYRATEVQFPDAGREISIDFHRAQFSPERWDTRQVGPYFIAAAR